MKRNRILKFLSVLCLTFMLISCSKKEVTSVYKATSTHGGYHVDLVLTFKSKGDKVQSLSHLSRIDFAKSEKTKQNLLDDGKMEFVEQFKNSPAIKNYEMVRFDDNELVEKLEIEYKEKNLEELMNLQLVQGIDGKPPEYVSLEQTVQSLLAQGYEKVTD